MANFFEILLLVCIIEVLIFEVASNAVVVVVAVVALHVVLVSRVEVVEGSLVSTIVVVLVVLASIDEIVEGSLVSTIVNIDAEVVLVSIGDVDIEAVIFVVEKVVGSVKLVT